MTRLNQISYILICAIAILTTLAYGTVHQPTIALFYFGTFLLVVLWGANALYTGTAALSGSKLQIPLLLLGVYALIQTIPFGSTTDSSGLSSIPRTISAEPFATQLAALHILALCAFFAMAVVYIDSAARLKRTAAVLTIFGFAYAFFAILQLVLSPAKIYGLYKPRSGIPFGSFVNRNDFAAAVEMLIAIPLGLLSAGAVTRDKRLLYLVGIIIIASSMLLSGSRGGFVALVSEIILILILTTRGSGRNKLLIRAALSVLLVLGAVGGAFFVGGDTSITRIGDPAFSSEYASSRAEIWSSTAKLIVSHLPFGAGLGAFRQAFTQFDTASGTYSIEQADNDYLQIAADAGVVGLILGTLFLYWFFREGLKSVRTSNTFRRGIAVGSFSGCFAILVHSGFDFVLHITAISILFLLLLGLLVASSRKYKDDDPDEARIPKSGERSLPRSVDARKKMVCRPKEFAARTPAPLF